MPPFHIVFLIFDFKETSVLFQIGTCIEAAVLLKKKKTTKKTYKLNVFLLKNLITWEKCFNFRFNRRIISGKGIRELFCLRKGAYPKRTSQFNRLPRVK